MLARLRTDELPFVYEPNFDGHSRSMLHVMTMLDRCSVEPESWDGSLKSEAPNTVKYKDGSW